MTIPLWITIILETLTQYSAPTSVVGMILFTLAWPKNFRRDETTRRKFTQFDHVGSILLLAASVLVVFGLQEAGTGEYAWNSAVVIATLVVGCLCWIGLFAWEYLLYRFKRADIAATYPMHLFSDRIMVSNVM